MLVAFERNQTELSLEGNGLHSTESISVVTENSKLEALDQETKSPLIYFRYLDDSGIRQVARSNDFDRFHFPVHQGRGIENGDDKVALVGANVLDEADSIGSSYVLGQESYEIIGVLGRNADSLLSYSVLIVDDSLFGRFQTVPTFIDGPKAAQIYSSFRGSDAYMQQDRSVNRRTSIDLIYPVIVLLGNLVLGAGAVCLGILVGVQAKKPNRIAWLLGRSRWKSLIETIGVLLLPASCFWLLGNFVGIATLGQELAGEIMTTLSWPLLAAIATLLVYTLLGMKRSDGWK